MKLWPLIFVFLAVSAAGGVTEGSHVGVSAAICVGASLVFLWLKIEVAKDDIIQEIERAKQEVVSEVRNAAEARKEDLEVEHLP